MNFTPHSHILFNHSMYCMNSLNSEPPQAQHVENVGFYKWEIKWDLSACSDAFFLRQGDNMLKLHVTTKYLSWRKKEDCEMCSGEDGRRNRRWI